MTITRPYISLPILYLFISTLFSPALSMGETKGIPLHEALSTIALKSSDLTIPGDLYSNPFAVERFSRWMKRPAKAPLEAQALSMDLLKSADDPEEWIKTLAKLGDVYDIRAIPIKNYDRYKLPGTLLPQLKKAIKILLDGLYTANTVLTDMMNSISPETRDSFKRYLYPDCYPGAGINETQGPIRIEALNKAIQDSGHIEAERILEAGLAVVEAVKKALILLEDAETWAKKVPSFSFKTTFGRVKIGGPSPDIHSDDAALILDLGGDDLYRGRIASGIEGKSAVVIDLDGDDVYLGENVTQAAGVWGIGLLIDLKGNDFYKAANCSQGIGLFGIGLLIDGAGMDTYQGEDFVQAASAWGWGGIIDHGGEDVYQCRRFGQAYSGAKGMSSICDLKGNDKYLSGSNAPDPREPDMNQSFSQGFSFGMRNVAAGGVALLADRAGNDLYQCQYFGQGASYWMGIGVLYDETGKDTYISRRYSQGAGIHYALGLLLDVEGNDHVATWAVSQGCGHDYGIGILVNEKGNDTYVSDWLSTGASEANGIGIFLDNAGNDGYDTKTGMAVGHLTRSRRAGGIALFLDAGGKDRYSKRGADNTTWNDNRWGVGMDTDAKGLSGINLLEPQKLSPAAENIDLKGIEESMRLSETLEKSESLDSPQKIEDMLSVASHWGLEGLVPKEAQDKLLSLDPNESVPEMLNLLHTPDIMSFIFMDTFFKVHAAVAIPQLIEQAKNPDPLIKSRTLYFLGHLKDTRVLDTFIEALGHPSWKVKASAIRGIGETLDHGRLDALLPMAKALEDSLEQKELRILDSYLEDGNNAAKLLSMVIRAVPMDYRTYEKFSEGLSGKNKEKVLSDFSHYVFERSQKILPLLEKWIQDIQTSEEIAKHLMPFMNNSEPMVRKASVYAIGQLHYEPAIPHLVSKLDDTHHWVRDATVLSLVLLKEKALPEIEAAFIKSTPSFKILAFDVLAGIKSERSKTLIQAYLEDPHDNVQRAAKNTLAGF